MSIYSMQVELVQLQSELQREQDPQKGLAIYAEIERLEEEIILEAEAELAMIEDMAELGLDSW